MKQRPCASANAILDAAGLVAQAGAVDIALLTGTTHERCQTIRGVDDPAREAAVAPAALRRQRP